MQGQRRSVAKFSAQSGNGVRMSRVGKAPVYLPEKVEVSVSDNLVKVKGPKGEIQYPFNKTVNITVGADEGKKLITVTPVDLADSQGRAMWGTARTLIANMVKGVSEGHTRGLEFTGVGYKAAISGSKLVLNLGYSHPIEYELPEGISAKVAKNVIEISGASKELVGFVAAKVRSFRPPEPYKGKGVKYSDEHIIRKAGKAGAKK